VQQEDYGSVYNITVNAEKITNRYTHTPVAAEFLFSKTRTQEHTQLDTPGENRRAPYNSISFV
jgi:hypothetical protein